MIVKFLTQKKSSLWALCTLCLLGLSSFVPMWLSISPYTIHQDFLNQPPAWLEGGSWQFLLGTDDLGRNFMIRLLAGAKISLMTGFIVMTISLFFGLLLGFGAALFRSFDVIVSTFVDTLMSFPGILLAIIVVSILGPSFFNACLAASLISAPVTIRLVRSLVLREMQKDYVRSAQASGAGFFRKVFVHILPSCMGEISVQSSLNFGEGVLNVAALSFLGLGAKAPLPEWGVMISDGKAYIDTSWWLICFPGFCILILVLCMQVLGEGLRDFFDPKARSKDRR